MRLWFATIAMLLPLCSAHAGAWLQPKGKGLAISQSTYFTSSEYYDADGALVPQDKFTKYELQPYIEYGLRDNLTIGATYYTNYVKQSGESNYGIADPEFFARTKLWEEGVHLISFQPLIKLPSFYKDSDTPRGGSKSVDVELSLLYGYSLKFFSDHDYIDMRAGYRWRSRGRAAQLTSDLAFGTQLSDNWQLISSARMIVSQEISTTFSENGDQDYSLMKSELTARYALDDTRSLHATLFAHASGIMTGAGQGITIGYGEKF